MEQMNTPTTTANAASGDKPVLAFSHPTMSMEEVLQLPVSFDLETAGRAIGIGRTKAYEMARKGQFPCKVLKLGNQYRVTRTELFQLLGLDNTPTVVLGATA